MKGLRSTVALLAVLIGLGAYIYFTGVTPTSESTKNEKVFPGLESAKVEELTVKSESGDRTALKKTDGAWSLVSPVTAAANDTNAVGIANVLGDVDVVRVVEENPASLKDYGLDAPQLEIGFKADGGKMAGTLLIGSKTATGGNMYARRDGQTRVILVGQYHEASLNKSTFDLRDKHIVKLDRAKIDGITVSVGGKTGELAKSGDEWKMTAPMTARADNSAVDGLFASVDGLEMTSVASTAPTPDELKAFGFDKPQASVTLRAGTDRKTLTVGGKGAAGVYVRDDSKPDVFTIEESSAIDFTKVPEDYRRREMFDMRAFTATRVELVRQGAAPVVFERVKAGEEGKPDAWKRTAPTAGDPDRSKVETLIAGLADIRATAFQNSTARTGLDSPTLTVIAKFDEGKKEERVTLGQSGTAAFAARPDDPGAATIEAEKLAETLKALDELAK